MKITVYGLPRSGKDLLISRMKNVTHIRGSDFLNKKSNGNFRSLTNIEQFRLRKELILFINNSDLQNVVVDGHYSFPDENGKQNIVFTEYDGDCYDAFFYIDTPAEIIKERIAIDDKNKIYSMLTIDELNHWKEFEITSLKKECFKRNKELVILDNEIEDSMGFLEKLISGSFVDPYIVADYISEQIMCVSEGKDTVVLLDCDKTLSLYDSSKIFCMHSGLKESVINSIFDRTRYSSYQFFKAQKIYNGVNDYNKIIEIVAEQIELNEKLINDIRKIPNAIHIGITSGIIGVWNTVSMRENFPDFIFGHVCTKKQTMFVSDVVKGFIAKNLQLRGKKVISIGDSMIDIFMLENSKNAYVIAEKTQSKSLKNYLISNPVDNIRQPSYNMIKFEGVKSVRCIYDSIKSGI